MGRGAPFGPKRFYCLFLSRRLFWQLSSDSEYGGVAGCPRLNRGGQDAWGLVGGKAFPLVMIM